MPDFDLDKALATPPDWWDACDLTKHKAATTCFCPGGGGDWEPLVKLHHLCDLFVYADLCTEGEESAASLRGFFERVGGRLHGELSWVEARELSFGTELNGWEQIMARRLDEHSPASADAYRTAVQPLAELARWGVEALLRHGVNGQGRDIRVLFLQGEALACYLGLYASRKLAPHAVVLPRQGGRRTVRSQQLSLDGPLGAVLREEPRPALMVAAQTDSAALAGTAWPHRWSNLPGWNRAAFTQWPLPAHWWFEALQVRF